jgi:hypothetical protein
MFGLSEWIRDVVRARAFPEFFPATMAATVAAAAAWWRRRQLGASAASSPGAAWQRRQLYFSAAVAVAARHVRIIENGMAAVAGVAAVLPPLPPCCHPMLPRRCRRHRWQQQWWGYRQQSKIN